MLLDKFTSTHLAWLVGIHLTFVISGLLFTVMDRVAAQTKKLECEAHNTIQPMEKAASSTEH